MNVTEEELRQVGFRFADASAKGAEWIHDFHYPTVKGSSLIVTTFLVREDDGFLLAARVGLLRDHTPGKKIVTSGVVSIEGDELEAARILDLKTLVSRLRGVLQGLFAMPLPEVLPSTERSSPTMYDRLLADEGDLR